MGGVNELFQNIRFLKYYGWGKFPFHKNFRMTSYFPFQIIAGENV